MSRLALGPILAPTNIPSWGIKQPGCEVHHSSTFFCSRMSGSTPLLPPIFLCGMHRGNFIIDLLNTSLQCCFKNNLCYRKHTTFLLKNSRSKILKEIFTISSENNNKPMHIVSGQTAESILTLQRGAFKTQFIL